jgi:hypothetical protein
MRDLELVGQWRAAQVERLSDSATRSFELVLSDPSRQNIVQAVEQLNAADAVTRRSVSAVLSVMMQNDFLSESSELSAAMEEIRSNLLLAADPRESSSAVPASE